MSPFAVLALVLPLALAVAAMLVLVVVVAGIHSEPRCQMATVPQRPLAAMVRRLLGVYVGRPDDADTGDDRAECPTGNSAEQRNRGRWD